MFIYVLPVRFETKLKIYMQDGCEKKDRNTS